VSSATAREPPAGRVKYFDANAREAMRERIPEVDKNPEMVIESSGPLRPPPSFVLCAARTGSTLLRYIFDTHPELCAPPELEIGALCQQLNRLHSYTVDTEQELEPVWAAASARRRTRRVVDDIMHEYCKRQGKVLWCEKSIGNLERLHVLDDVYPDARLVFLHRHCLDVAYSALEVERDLPGRWGFEAWIARRSDDPFAALVEYWCDSTERLLAYEKANERRSARLRYEDLVRQPRRVLPRVFDLLDLDWDPAMLDRVFVAHHARGPGDGKIARTSRIEPGSIGRGFRQPWRTLPPKILERVQSLLQQLNYPRLGAEDAAA
jgi:hypothetical protein